AGIFVLTGLAAGEAGPALILAFLLNGIVTTFTAMAYAELGSAYPEAGGAYVWVKEGLGGANGFLSGWMSWSAAAVAGSLYGLGFGHFAVELLDYAGMSDLGIDNRWWVLGFTTLIIALFTVVNSRGASEAGTVGNVVTIAKVLILVSFVAFGLAAMLRTENWENRFTDDFMPNGISGVVIAMGLTFIAFEGYEIIAQSGEEVIDPKKNIPRAIFLSIAIVVVIYIAVAFVALGALNLEEGELSYEVLAEQKETAVVEAAADFMPIGKVLLLISGLASTMSALNATTYSSSRVSFAMGRDHNLPPIFARIHPVRHTPYYAVMISGVFMTLVAWLLPIEDVAAAADIMYLLLFLLVNVTVMTLRQKLPNLDRGFVIPWFPIVPIIGLITNAGLAIYLFTFSPQAWYVAAAWLTVGALLYYAYFSKIEALEKPSDILHEEVLVSRNYSVLVPIATNEQAEQLGYIGALIAGRHDGEVMALYVAEVPPSLSLADGRVFLRAGRDYLETMIGVAREREVPVHTMIRLGRNVAQSVRKTAVENASDMIVLGWPGSTNTSGRVFGSVIDPIVDNPPTDIVVVRFREERPLRSILVPIAGGPNSRRSVELAVTMAQQASNGVQTRIVLFSVVPANARVSAKVRVQKFMDTMAVNLNFERVEIKTAENENTVDAILKEAKSHDMVIIGASEEPLFQNMLLGTVPEQVARRAVVTVIMVKRRSSPMHSFLRQTVLEPTTGASVKRDLNEKRGNGKNGNGKNGKGTTAETDAVTPDEGNDD
ncbi:MAG: amino acid permease, partial [Anaerolineae bacterium]|nr:amino acid permease [Anaerolineae bacterium]